MLQIISERNPVVRMVLLITTVFFPLPETPSPLILCLSTSSLCTRCCWSNPRKFNHINFPTTLLLSSRSEFFHLHRAWSCFQPRKTNATTTTTEQNRKITTISPPPPKQSKPTKSVSQSLFHKQEREKSIQIPRQNISSYFQSKHQCFPQNNPEGNH